MGWGRLGTPSWDKFDRKNKNKEDEIDSKRL